MAKFIDNAPKTDESLQKRLANLRPWRKGDPFNCGKRIGRTKDAIAKWLREYLDDEQLFKDGQKLQRIQAIVSRLFSDSIRGDHKATNILLERAYGKVKDQVEVSGDIVESLGVLLAKRINKGEVEEPVQEEEPSDE